MFGISIAAGSFVKLTTGRRPTRPLEPFFPFISVAKTDIPPQAVKPGKQAQKPPTAFPAEGMLMRIRL